MGYEVEKLAQGLWAIEDEFEDTLYLVEGEKRAMAIDTGMSEQPLMPLLRKLTDRPIDLALTHGHVDHMRHADEFEQVYLHEKDGGHWRELFAGKNFSPIAGGDLLALGGNALIVCEAAGHTQGSVVLIDRQHEVIFTGDAIGSGDEAMLWLEDSDHVSAYAAHLEKLEKDLQDYAGYRFFGGHRRQAKRPGAAWPDMQNIRDMRILCGLMLEGKAVKEPYILPPFFHAPAQVQAHIGAYRFHKALMIAHDDKIY